VEGTIKAGGKREINRREKKIKKSDGEAKKELSHEFLRDSWGEGEKKVGARKKNRKRNTWQERGQTPGRLER